MVMVFPSGEGRCKERSEVTVWCPSAGQPFLTMFANKLVIVQLGIGTIDAVDFLALAGAEPLAWVETADVFEKPLPAQHLVQSGNAAGIAVGGIEKSRVGVGYFYGAPEHFERNRFVGANEPATLGMHFHR